MIIRQNKHAFQWFTCFEQKHGPACFVVCIRTHIRLVVTSAPTRCRHACAPVLFVLSISINPHAPASHLDSEHAYAPPDLKTLLTWTNEPRRLTPQQQHKTSINKNNYIRHGIAASHAFFTNTQRLEGSGWAKHAIPTCNQVRAPALNSAGATAYVRVRWSESTSWIEMSTYVRNWMTLHKTIIKSQNTWNRLCLDRKRTSAYTSSSSANTTLKNSSTAAYAKFTESEWRISKQLRADPHSRQSPQWFLHWHLVLLWEVAVTGK